MPAFFNLLKQDPQPSVRVVLGHFMFVYIHPYIDGNGRMGLKGFNLRHGPYPKMRFLVVFGLFRLSYNITTWPHAGIIAGKIAVFLILFYWIFRKLPNML